MNIALIFAGGTGQRMNTKSIPKQFLELHGKPIIIYTLEHFENHPEIDHIVVVCLNTWIDYLAKLLNQYNFKKVASITPGAETGQLSIFNGLVKIEELFPNDSVVLIHDGVRPLIDKQIISANINSTRINGNCITVSNAIETISLLNLENNQIKSVIDRNDCKVAKAPQSFILKDIITEHRNTMRNNEFNVIDSASMMLQAGYTLYTTNCSTTNIKITTPMDFYMFKAILDSRENAQIYGNELC